MSQSTIKSIYCVSELHDWIDVSKYFYDHNGWEPVLWLTTSKNYSYLKKVFPNIDSIDFHEANRGNLENISLERNMLLDEQILLKYLKYEKQAIKMMDRMDPIGYSFNYSQRIQLYYNILEFIINYINNTNPEKIIFAETPHSVFTYVIYAVAIENKIDIIRFSPTHIFGNTFLTTSLRSSQQYILDEYNKIQDIKLLNHEVEEYYNNLKDRTNNAIPYYMIKVRQENRFGDFGKIIKVFLKTIKYFFRIKKREGYFKYKENSIRDRISNRYYAIAFFKAELFKIKLRQTYQKYVVKTKLEYSLDDKFIYFPLQYQPEKSSSPEGDFFVDQYLAISMLTKLSKGRYKVFIKEHISQFSSHLKGQQGRVFDFYRELSLLPNIVFVDPIEESLKLIEKSIAVSTITGTAGFEALMKEKPSIIFGFPWYKDCDGVFNIKVQDDLIGALNLILVEYKVDVNKVKYFLQAIFNVSEKIYINNSNKSSIKNTAHNNTQSIIRLIQKYGDRLN